VSEKVLPLQTYYSSQKQTVYVFCHEREKPRNKTVRKKRWFIPSYVPWGISDFFSKQFLWFGEWVSWKYKLA
jgi:hypothetical protein